MRVCFQEHGYFGSGYTTKEATFFFFAVCSLLQTSVYEIFRIPERKILECCIQIYSFITIIWPQDALIQNGTGKSHDAIF